MTGFICMVPLVSALFSNCAEVPPLATGYVEGEFVLIAPIETAAVAQIAVRRGQRVVAGAVLADMQRRDAEITLAQAEAEYAEAEAHLADLQLGKRPEEIAVIAAALASARAQSEEASRNASRLVRLAESGSATTAERDEAETAKAIAVARVAETEADLAVANLPARPQAIAAAEAVLRRTDAARNHAEWALDNRRLVAPAAGEITDILRRPGEVAGPSSPVLSLLPDGAVKLRLYAPAPSVAGLKVGGLLAVRCDGCAEGLTAQISYIADQPEFTPPVIYSLENRQKLVVMIEARPAEGSTALKPGQIVDVVLAEPPR